MTERADIIALVDTYGWDDVIESLMAKAYEQWQSGEIDADLYNELENVFDNYLPDD